MSQNRFEELVGNVTAAQTTLNAAYAELSTFLSEQQVQLNADVAGMAAAGKGRKRLKKRGTQDAGAQTNGKQTSTHRVPKPSEARLNQKEVNALKNLKGQVVSVTGALEEYTRAEVQARIEKLGGTVGRGVNGKTTMVIVGKKAGNKYERAVEMGLATMTEKQFAALK